MNTAIVLMPTASSAKSLIHCYECGEAAAAAIVHGTLGALLQLHKLGYLHADVKPDNFLLVPTETPEAPRCASDLGLSARVVGIDLARAIDMEVEACKFQSGHHTELYRCPEMTEPLSPFMYQVDMYGVAVIAFLLLFGYEAIEPLEASGAVPCTIEGVPCYTLPRGRYELQDKSFFGMDDVDPVWHSTFATLLNGRVGGTRGEAFHFASVQKIRDELAAFVRARKVVAKTNLNDELMSLITREDS
jgi:serine/threonine protein kinase